MAREWQRRTVEVERGLFLIRYATADDEHEPPRISLSVDLSSRQALQLIAPPGELEAALWRPGASLVLLAEGSGKLIVEVEARPGSRSAASSVRLEPLGVGRSTLKQRPLDSGAPFDLSGLTLIGHVAGRGDVSVKADEWLAGPSAPSRIEGIAIEWQGKPEGVGVRYSVSTARPQPTSQRTLNIGEFGGSRGKALPLVGVAFEVTGDAPEVQLAVEAIFLGSPSSRAVGRRISLVGPTGREPLVGLKITAEKLGGATMAKSTNRQDPGRVRVFRGRPKSSSAEEASRERAARAG